MTAGRLLGAILRLRLLAGLPLHVGGIVSPPALEGNHVIHHVARTGTRWRSGRGARVGRLECPARRWAAADAAVGVPFASRAELGRVAGTRRLARAGTAPMFVVALGPGLVARLGTSPRPALGRRGRQDCKNRRPSNQSPIPHERNNRLAGTRALAPRLPSDTICFT
jgi:hypothetical protein